MSDERETDVTPKPEATGDRTVAADGRADEASDDRRDASAATKPGGGSVGDQSSATSLSVTEAAHEGSAQNIPVRAGGVGGGPEVVDVRRGMFGVTQGGDTTGYGGLVRTIAMPGPSERPYGGWFDEVVDILAEVLEEGGTRYDDAIEKVVVDRGELTLYVRREHLLTVCQALRDDQDLRFDLGMSVSGVHWPNDTGRELHAVYHLISVTHSRWLRLEVAVPDADPHLPSATSVYPGLDWHERETWDFFGIIFDGHPALARIQMPDDWPGHPQRKDYPLGGIPVEYKGASIPPPDERRSYN